MKSVKEIPFVPMPEYRLGATEVVIIRAVQALGARNAYGAAVQRHIRAVVNRVISLGQIATTLERLQAKGLLTSHHSAPEPVRGGRAKRVFELEERGVMALEYAVTSHAMIFESNRKVANHGRTEEAEG
jgi:PadR family transcriptional regulator, regulatory protein PadR